MFSSPSTSSASIPTKKTRSDLVPSPANKWRSGAQQRIYGRRLLEALKVAHGGIPPGAPPATSQTIKDAADSALALTARGQTRWSRSLLFRRRKLLLKAGGKIRRRKPPRLTRKTLADLSPETGLSIKSKKVKDRLRVLSRIVPGCRKLSTPNLLEETADYVGALQMQVKMMRALADALSAAALSSPVGDSGLGLES